MGKAERSFTMRLKASVQIGGLEVDGHLALDLPRGDSEGPRSDRGRPAHVVRTGTVTYRPRLWARLRKKEEKKKKKNLLPRASFGGSARSSPRSPPSSALTLGTRTRPPAPPCSVCAPSSLPANASSIQSPAELGKTTKARAKKKARRRPSSGCSRRPPSTRPRQRSRKMWSTPLLLLPLLLASRSAAFNLDARVPVVKSGGVEGGYFGFSVAQHRMRRGPGESLILVGAPVDQNVQPGTNRSGALYRCPLTAEIQVSGSSRRHIHFHRFS